MPDAKRIMVLGEAVKRSSWATLDRCPGTTIQRANIQNEA
jgi:hypothetical protein